MKERNDTLEASQEFKLFIKNLFAPIKKEARNHRLKSEFHTPEDLKLSPSRLERMYKDLSLEDINNFLKDHSKSASPEALELLDALSWIKSHDEKRQNGVVNCGSEGLRLYKNRQIISLNIQFDSDPKNSKLTIVDNSDAMLTFANSADRSGKNLLNGGYISTNDGQRLLITTSSEKTNDHVIGTKHCITLTDKRGTKVSEWKGSFNEDDPSPEVLWPLELNEIKSPEGIFTLAFKSGELLSNKINVVRSNDPYSKKGELIAYYGASQGETDFFGYVSGEKVIGVSARIDEFNNKPNESKVLIVREHIGKQVKTKEVKLTKAKIRAFINEGDQKNIDAVINSVADPLLISINSR